MAEAKHGRITVDPRVMAGKPCIRGSHIPVEQVLFKPAGGMTGAGILDAHPRLAAEDVYAAAYATDVVASKDIDVNPDRRQPHDLSPRPD
jgi:uncharacterized protein (DUF433 family)